MLEHGDMLKRLSSVEHPLSVHIKVITVKVISCVMNLLEFTYNTAVLPSICAQSLSWITVLIANTSYKVMGSLVLSI